MNIITNDENVYDSAYDGDGDGDGVYGYAHVYY